jgi:hypothetical protein
MARAASSGGSPRRPGDVSGRDVRAQVFQMRTRVLPARLPRTIQLCIHCRDRPAGFWVSCTGGQTVRRPWCLSCCEGLDRDRCDMIPFDS